MICKKYLLTFPEHMVETPIAGRLVSSYGLEINILKARVEPNKEGTLVLELRGSAQSIESGISFLSNQGIQVEPMFQGVCWNDDLCIECTACRSVCPSGALMTRYPEMSVYFNGETCIACELCVQACPYGAMQTVV